MYIHINIQIYTYVYIYMYVYIYIHMYFHIHTYIYYMNMNISIVLYIYTCNTLQHAATRCNTLDLMCIIGFVKGHVISQPCALQPRENGAVHWHNHQRTVDFEKYEQYAYTVMHVHIHMYARN